MTDDLADAIAAVATETDFSGVVSVTEGDTTTVAAAYGLADRAHAVANTTATRFAIASGTKTFTALTVMRLVESGLVDLDTTARSVLGDDLPLIDDAVTVEHLLAHRSGIGDYFDEEELDVEDHVLTVPLHTLESTEDWLPVLDGHPQVSAPGATWAYNNGGYVLLALLAERISLVPFPALVDELVVAPAGLTTTGFHRADGVTPELAVGYLNDGRTNVLHLPAVGAGDGGLSTTLGDVEQLWRAVNAGDVVTPATLADMTRDRSGATGDDRRHGLGFWLAPAGRDGVILEGCDAGMSFRSTHRAADAVTWTVIGNTTDGAWPVARLLAERLG
jgi:CubicO group peptidase (beta-lactamase class C family)